jgi:DnaJ-class molecular chaperone
MQVRITGEGDAGANGGPPGNLYVQVRVQEHALFARDDEDLVLRMDINIAEAALGLTKPVPTLDGQEVDLEIPAGTQSGRVFRVRGYGVPRLRRDGRATNRRGDIRVVVDVNVPQRVNRYQRKLLEDLAYSLANHGNAPPSPAKSKPTAKRKSQAVEEPEPAQVEQTDQPDPPAGEEEAAEDKQKGLFDRIKDTFTPNDD